MARQANRRGTRLALSRRRCILRVFGCRSIQQRREMGMAIHLSRATM